MSEKTVDEYYEILISKWKLSTVNSSSLNEGGRSMEEKSKAIPVDLLEKVTGGVEEVPFVEDNQSITDDSLEDLPEKKKKRLGDIFGDN